MLGRSAGLLVWLAVAVIACAHREPLRVGVLPDDAEARRRALYGLSAALFEGMRSGQIDELLVRPAELDHLVTSDARLRVERERAHHHREPQPSVRDAWREATFLGFCAQGVHIEPPGGGYGLRESAFAADRLLVVAETDQRRSAAWVEGRFVYTDQGFRALGLGRMEIPRIHHADLELAPCDVEQGFR